MEKIFVKNILNLNEVLYQTISLICKNANFICKPIIQYFVEDYPTNRIDYEKLFNEFYNIPSGTSARNVNHWIQMFSSKQFGQYDYGKDINFLKYGQMTPPEYDLSKFKKYTVKSLMTVSDADPFSKIEDCEHLFQHINNDVLTLIKLKDFNHLDYLWSKDASELLYLEIIKFLK